MGVGLMRASLGVLLGGLVAAQQVHLAALSATPLQCDAQAAAKWNGANGAEPNNFTRGATENLRAVKAAFNHLAYHGQDIKFFLAEGSLLGWYRQCMPIPWDTDLDIGVMIDDLHLGVGFLKEAMREQGFVLAGEVGTKAAGLTFIFFRESGYLQEETARSTAHGMVRTDIHFFYKDTKTNQFYLQIFNGDTTYRNSYDAFELRPAEGFGGVHLHVPHPAERYLEQIYGDFMKPRKDSQHMVAGEALNITDVAWDHLESAKNVKADDTASFLESMRWKPLGPAATVRAIVKFCGGWFPFVTGVTVASLMAYLAYQRNVQHSRARQEVSEKANAKKSKKLEEYRRGELNRMRADRLQRETEQAKQQAAKRQLVAERKAKEEEEVYIVLPVFLLVDDWLLL